MFHWLIVPLLAVQTPAPSDQPGLFVQTIQLVQTVGTQAAALPENDQALKSAIAVGLAKDRTLTFNEVKELIKSDDFLKLAGEDAAMTADEITEALNHLCPKSRARLLPALRNHAEYLATTYDMISEPHLQSAHQLADWLATKINSPDPLHVVVVCTGNSRRSMLGACMGNLAAAYHGLDKIRFHSGGTSPTAFNRRTIESLRSIGFEIKPTGQEAPRGESQTANPKFHITWGTEFESIEYSKLFSDSSNPKQNFAAVMVCTEADSECPTVPGAAFRLSMPFLDPKSYDDSKYETAKYAERRDDIGRTLMAAMAMVSRNVKIPN